jgi:hypothetical protein
MLPFLKNFNLGLLTFSPPRMAMWRWISARARSDDRSCGRSKWLSNPQSRYSAAAEYAIQNNHGGGLQAGVESIRKLISDNHVKSTQVISAVPGGR